MKNNSVDIVLGRPISTLDRLADSAACDGRIDPDRELLWIARSEKPLQSRFRPGPYPAPPYLVEFGPDGVERQVHLAMLQQ